MHTCQESDMVTNCNVSTRFTALLCVLSNVVACHEKSGKYLLINILCK